MLEFFRRHLSGIFGITIVSLLVLVFALSFGTQSKGWGAGQTERQVASVKGSEISELTLRYAINLLVGGSNLDMDDPQISYLRSFALEGLIERQLLIDLANEFGVSASKDEAEERIASNKLYLTQPIEKIAESVQSNPLISPAVFGRILVSDGHMVNQSFLDERGIFDIERYKKFVRYFLQFTEEGFVEQQRLEIMAERMRQILASSVHVSESEVRNYYNRENNTVKVDYVKFVPTYFAEKLAPTPEEIKEWADAHRQEIEQYFETNKYRYTNLEKMVRARHILIKTGETATEEEKNKARGEIQTLLDRIKAGESFDAVARESSQDKETAAKGGDLGFNPQGKMSPELDKAIFETKPGELSGIVEEKDGFHIVKVEGIREGNVSLEEASPEIAELLMRRAKGEEQAKVKADEALSKLKAGEKMAGIVPPESETDPYGGLAPKVLNSRPFTRTSTTISGIGDASEIVALAFALNETNPVIDKVFNVGADYIVVSLAERNLPTDEGFEKMKAGLTETLLSLKQAAWLRDQIVETKRQAEQDGEIERSISVASQRAVPEQRNRPSEESPAEPPKAPVKTRSEQPPQGGQEESAGDQEGE